MLSGCGSSISQEDYDAKVSELETLQKDYNSKASELETLQKDYDSKVSELEAVQKELTKLKAENKKTPPSETESNSSPEKSESEDSYATADNNLDTNVSTEDSDSISTDKFIENVKIILQGAIGENESITDVTLDNEDLCIYVDFSQIDPSPLTLEDIAFARTSSITDEILDLKEYDSLWNTITVDFGELGHVKNGKDNIKDDGFGPYFSSISFKLE